MTATLAAVFCAVGASESQNAAANGETRTLSIFHSHTKEAADITFMRNGQYDPEGLQKLNWILRDWRKDEPIKMDPQLFDLVWAVYREVGSHEPIVIMSAYRSPGTNAMLRRRSSAVAKNSQHMAGKAMDIHLQDVSMQTVREVGLRLQRGGVGYYPTAGSPFVHLDTGTVRHWPRVSHEYLAKLFPDGKTVHIPSDGQPLEHYAEAAAEISARGGSAIALADLNSNRGKSFWATLFGGGGEDEDDDRPVQRGRGGAGRTVVASAAAPFNTGSNSDDNGARGFVSGVSPQPNQARLGSPVPDQQLRLPQPAAAAPAPAPQPAPTFVATAPDNVLTTDKQDAPKTPIPLPPQKPVLLASLQNDATPGAGQFALASIPMPPIRPADLTASAIPLPPLRPVIMASAPSAVITDAPPRSFPSAIFGPGQPLPAAAAAYASPENVPTPPARISAAVAPTVASVLPSTLAGHEPARAPDTARNSFSIDYGVRLDRMGLTSLINRVADENRGPQSSLKVAETGTKTVFGGQGSGVRLNPGGASAVAAGHFSGSAVRPLN